ncbi:Lrp/AsnC family transcriptional regulator [Ferrovibrio sp.]|uniref:Lrp/AsnC family transcriptional regulator n=1 Tax=Ferrovibrio sp. TaxID=1917215 RepID=UPI000CAB6451|nr:Lrp/AsnC family transcriptional regulator [Ferrovibrio sp.]PJI43490.1 MAG: ArsR family transcriptional regulator [Ferrovibrio sp.]
MSKEVVVLDQIDKRIVKALQDNARLSSQELSAQVGISASPCWRRVKALEEAGVITKYVTLVDPEALGLSISIFTSVSLDKQIETALETFQKAVRKRPEVMECYLMTGDFDYLLRVVVGSLHDYERFLLDHLTRIPGVASIKSSFALKQVKYTTALPVG